MRDRQEKRPPEDDGRTVADMSGLEYRPVFRPGKRRELDPPQEPKENDRPWEQPETFTKEERRMYLLGAVSAALLIGLVFLAGMLAVVLLFLWLWG